MHRPDESHTTGKKDMLSGWCMGLTHQQVCSILKQIVGIEDSLVMPSQVWANGFARGKAHVKRNLGPSPVLADDVKPALLCYQLKWHIVCYKSGLTRLLHINGQFFLHIKRFSSSTKGNFQDSDLLTSTFWFNLLKFEIHFYLSNCLKNKSLN